MDQFWTILAALGFWTNLAFGVSRYKRLLQDHMDMKAELRAIKTFLAGVK